VSRHRTTPKDKLTRKRGFCTWCGKKVNPPRQSWCGDECLHQYKLRSWPGYARHLVFQRDRGVCAACGLDTEALERDLGELRNRASQAWGHRGATEPGESEGRAAAYRWLVAEARQLLREHGFKPEQFLWTTGARTSRSLWDADHIVPVCEGGGECALDNYRTLCVPCHRRVTAELSRRRAAARRGQLTLGGVE
jgi:hypothetical protein